MRPELYPIPTPTPGRLAILARPRGDDWLDDEVAGWQREGVRAVVSLLTPDEEAELGLAGERGACADRGIEFRSLPVPDRGLPASRKAVAELAAELARKLNAGETVGVHCRQGIGRSAVLAVAVLNALGIGPEKGIRQVAAARGRPVPETAEQQEWLLGLDRVPSVV